MKKVFTTGQVAKICKVAPRTASKWFDTGKLKGYRQPGKGKSERRIIPRTSLIKFMKEHGIPLGSLESEEFLMVLVIGTEQHLNDRLIELLPESDGVRLYFTDSAFEAGILAESLKLGFFIVDSCPVKSDKLSIIRQLRGREDFAQSTIISIAAEDEGSIEDHTEAGADDVFRTPFDIQLLVERLKTLHEQQMAA